VADDQARGVEASEPSRRRLGPELQVLVGLGSLVALLAGAVGVAVFLIVGLTDNTTDLSRPHVEYATSIQEAALGAKAIANFERRNPYAVSARATSAGMPRPHSSPSSPSRREADLAE
jgi:hypothetical protein